MGNWTAGPHTETKRRGFTGPLLLIALGCGVLASNLGWAPDFGHVWPVILITVGLALFADRMLGR
jgi:hypothetical protein